MSSYSATNSLLRDKVDTDPAKDAENRVSKMEAKLIKRIQLTMNTTLIALDVNKNSLQNMTLDHILMGFKSFLCFSLV